MLEQFSATIDKIYAAAAGSVAWDDALVTLENLTGSAGAVIDLIPKSNGVAPKTLAGSFSEENCAEYARDYQAICPRIRHAIDHPEQETQFDYLFMTEAEMDRDPVYDWFGKHGLRYYLGGIIAETPNYLVVSSIQRTRRQGHVGQADLDLFALLRPHIARAVTLADQLGTLRSYRSFGSAMLEAMPQAVFALDSAGSILFANLAARHLLAGGDGLRIEGRRLRTAVPAEQSRLDAMIRGATDPLGPAEQGWARVSRRSGGPPFPLFVAPLRVADDTLTSAGAKALVLVHDTFEQRCASVGMLTSVYGLTETEARLASALSGGHSLESAGALLHMRPATARTHLKAVFRKMGVCRQQDLIRMLAPASMMGSAPA